MRIRTAIFITIASVILLGLIGVPSIVAWGLSIFIGAGALVLSRSAARSSNSLNDIMESVRIYAEDRSPENHARMERALQQHQDPLRELSEYARHNADDESIDGFVAMAIESVFLIRREVDVPPIPRDDLFELARILGETGIRRNKVTPIMNGFQRSLVFCNRDWDNPVSTRFRQELMRRGLFDPTALNLAKTVRSAIDLPVVTRSGDVLAQGQGLEVLQSVLDHDVPDVEEQRAVGERIRTVLAMVIDQGQLTTTDVQDVMGLTSPPGTHETAVSDGIYMGRRVVGDLCAFVDQDSAGLAKSPLAMGKYAVADATAFYLAAYCRLFNEGRLETLAI